MTTTTKALRDAAREARTAWGPLQTLSVAAVAVAAGLPWFAPGWVHIDTLAGWLYLALAATGLVVTVGFAGLPSLGQGAFMSIGAFTTALLVARAGWPAFAALPVALAASLVAGVVTGVVIVRLPPLFVAVSTWILTWLVVTVAAEFPGVSGGSQGFVVRSPLDATGHYELGLALTVGALVIVSALRRSSVGVRLRAARDHSAGATSLGVPTDRLMLGAFVASATIGGLAGTLGVQLAGVSDPNAFGPFTSFKLLVAVLLGGASYACAGAAGVAILGAIALAGRLWAAIQGHAPAQLQPMLASLLLLAVLGLGGEGLIPLLARLRRPTAAAPRASSERERQTPAALTARGLRKAYGGVHALAGLDLDVAPGEAVALVGANGSGKTTALRALAGAVPLDAGEIALDGARLTGRSPAAMAGAGIVRTLQRTATFASLTALENVEVGAGLGRRHSGPFRSVAATPRSRAESRAIRGLALESLRTVGLEGHAGTRAELLGGYQQRLVMLAAALAARPRLLLLDEPSAGATAAEVGSLAVILAEIRSSGISLLLVEHNLRLVNAVADRVLVIADGKVERP